MVVPVIDHFWKYAIMRSHMIDENKNNETDEREDGLDESLFASKLISLLATTISYTSSRWVFMI